MSVAKNNRTHKKVILHNLKRPPYVGGGHPVGIGHIVQMCYHRRGENLGVCAGQHERP